MVAYSFKKRFVGPLEAGTKDQTMRNERHGRSRHARPLDLVQIYYAMRTKQCRRIAERVCTLSVPVSLSMGFGPRVRVDGAAVLDLDRFARRDGFTDFDDLSRFWWDEHSAREWSGRLIRWEVPHGNQP